MKILAVNSSMRKGGNTDVIIDEALRACSDSGCAVEKLYLGDLAIQALHRLPGMPERRCENHMHAEG